MTELGITEDRYHARKEVHGMRGYAKAAFFLSRVPANETLRIKCPLPMGKLNVTEGQGTLDEYEDSVHSDHIRNREAERNAAKSIDMDSAEALSSTSMAVEPGAGGLPFSAARAVTPVGLSFADS